MSYFTVGGSSYERIVSVYKDDILDGVFSILDGTFNQDKPVWKNDTKFLFYQVIQCIQALTIFLGYWIRKKTNDNLF